MKEIESQIYSKDARAKRLDNQVIDGKPSVLFEVNTGDAEVKLWVNNDTGLIYKRRIEFISTFMFKGNIETNYGPDSDGNQVVRFVNSNVLIKMPFRKAIIQITDKFSNWISHP